MISVFYSDVPNLLPDQLIIWLKTTVLSLENFPIREFFFVWSTFSKLSLDVFGVDDKHCCIIQKNADLFKVSMQPNRVTIARLGADINIRLGDYRLKCRTEG